MIFLCNKNQIHFHYSMHFYCSIHRSNHWRIRGCTQTNSYFRNNNLNSHSKECTTSSNRIRNKGRNNYKANNIPYPSSYNPFQYQHLHSNCFQYNKDRNNLHNPIRKRIVEYEIRNLHSIHHLHCLLRNNYW